MTSGGRDVSLNRTSCSYQVCWDIAPASHAMYVTALVLVIAFSLPLNIWVLWLGTKQCLAKSLSETLTLNLAAMDVLFCFHSGLCLLMAIVCNRALSYVQWYAMHVAFCGRVFFNSFICVERYVAVVHPLTYRSPKMRRFRLWCSGLTWPTSLGLSVVHLVCETPFSFYIVPMFFTLAVNIFCSRAILRTLVKPKPGEGDSADVDRVKRNAFRVVAITLAVSVACGCTYGGMNLTWASLHHFCVSNAVCAWLYSPSFLPHPLLYLSKAGKLKFSG